MGTEKERDAALAALQAMRDCRLDTEGGYPAAIDGHTIRGYVVIADADDNDGPELVILRWRDVLRWYRDAVRCLSEADPEEIEISPWEEDNGAVPGIVWAMYEVEPARSL